MNIPQNYFTRMDNTKPYVKCGIIGFGGEGKSTTGMYFAIGLARAIGTTKPVMVLNSELSAAPFKRKFLEAGLEIPLVRDTRSFADLLDVMEMMRQGVSDILLIDEIFRYHVDFKQGYKNRPLTWDPPRPARTRLDPSDRELLGEEWELKFGQHFVDDRYHIIMCGRAGYNYDDERDEETGRMAQYKGAIKFKGDSQLNHLPDLLIEMELIETEGPDRVKEVFRRATVKKDRWDVIDGKVFRNPTFSDFADHVASVLDRPVERTSSPARQSTAIFFNEDDRREFRKHCEIATENIESLLQHAIPGQAAKDKQTRIDILYNVFNTHSEQEWKGSKLEDLQTAYSQIQQALVDLGYAEWTPLESGKRAFGIKGLPPIVIPPREQLAGEVGTYETITPKPLKEAHQGLAKLETEKDELDSQNVNACGIIGCFIKEPHTHKTVATLPPVEPVEAKTDKSDRQRRTDAFLALAKEMKWTDAAALAFLESEGFDSAEKISVKKFPFVYQRLLDQELRDKFIEMSHCEAGARR